jgi:hypothetical protein
MARHTGFFGLCGVPPGIKAKEYNDSNKWKK